MATYVPATPTTPVNVHAFGAVGDGVHDDTVAIQAAINAASAGLGGVVYLPPGGYRTSAPLTLTTDSISLVGAGVDNAGGHGTQLLPDGSFDAIVIGTLNSVAAGQCRVENLTIAYTGTPTAGAAIHTYSGLNLFRRLWIANAYEAIRFEGGAVAATYCEDIWAPSVVGPYGFYWIQAPGGGKCVRCFVGPQSDNTALAAFAIDTGSGSVTLDQCVAIGAFYSVAVLNTQNGTAPANIWVRKFSADGIPAGIPFYLAAGTMIDLDTCWSDGGQHHVYVGPAGAQNLRILNCNFQYAQEDGIYVATATTPYDIVLTIEGSTICNSGISASATYSDITLAGGTNQVLISHTMHAVATGSSALHAINIGPDIDYWFVDACDVHSVSGTAIVSQSVSGAQKAANNLGFNPVGPITPPASPFVSGTVYQNTAFVDYTIYQPAYATASGTAGTVAVALGPASTPPTIFTKQIPGTTSSAAPDLVEIRVPAGWYYSFTASAATLATATVMGE